MTEARCSKCKHRFKYEPVFVDGQPRGRHVCDDCRRSRARFLKKQWKKQVRAPMRDRGDKEDRAAPNEFTSRQVIAQALGIDHSTVEDIERKALAKIRNSPALVEAFAHYAEAGMPRIKELIGELTTRKPKTDRAALLLEYQLQVADFWAVYESLVAQAAKLDAVPEPFAELPLWRQRERRAGLSVLAELEAILAEIAGIQSAIKKELTQA